MSRRCSHCGHNGHNSRTCLDKGFKLFGVRLTESSSPSSPSSIFMRKSVSLGNLSSYASAASPSASPSASPLEQPDLGDSADGYASDDLVHASRSARQRKKGVPWTEEEHRSFLLGLQKLGKGDWRGISRNFVKTRTPTQVASHAQKYFLRRNNLNKRRRRSSLFDITPDAVSSLLEESLVEESFEEPDMCPVVNELSLGLTTTPVDVRNRESSILSRHGYPIGGFPMPLTSLPLTCMPISVSEIREEASEVGETEDLENCEMTEAADETFSQPSAVMPAAQSIPETNGNCGRESSHSSFSFPLFSMWPGPVVHCAEKHATWFSESKILKPTPIVPTLPPAMDDTMKLSKLSLSTARPVMEPTPLSYKLLEEGSRHSAFHTTASASNSELDPQGSLTNAISVP